MVTSPKISGGGLPITSPKISLGGGEYFFVVTPPKFHWGGLPFSFFGGIFRIFGAKIPKIFLLAPSALAGSDLTFGREARQKSDVF